MKLSREALVALQQMMGKDGSVFMRDLFLNHWHGHPGPEHYVIFHEQFVNMEVFEELKKANCITLHIESYCRDSYRLNNVGRKALKDAGMETKRGKLTRDDIQWLAGTGYYAQ
ncbi:MAG: hypothetical protein Q8Q89_02365 [bacterium]|nr:hypothetical protein [bacterium]